MKSFFLPLLLLISQLVDASPSSPLTSENSPATLQAIRRRQATSKQIVQRMRDGPRRRTDPSAVPPPVCNSVNLLTNGNFQAGYSLTPWVLAKSSTTSSISQINSGSWGYPIGETGTHYSFFTAASSTSLVTLSQTVAIPQLNQRYSLTFNLGASSSGQNSCPITVSAGDKSVTFNRYCRTGDTTCTRAGLASWTPQTLSNIQFASSTETVLFTFDCTGLTAAGTPSSTASAYVYLLDTVSLRC